jgi:predicted Zn-dependent protease
MAEDLYKTLIKKYKDSKKVWIKYGQFKFRQNQPEAARTILDRAIQCLPKRKRNFLDSLLFDNSFDCCSVSWSLVIDF